VPKIYYNYANKAFIGVVQHSRSGWAVTMNRPDLLAQKISELNKNRKVISTSTKLFTQGDPCTARLLVLSNG
jgi:hypothetical protein